MYIIMLSTHCGCEDGFVVREYQHHKSYDVRSNLARDFIRRGWARALTTNDLITDPFFTIKEIL